MIDDGYVKFSNQHEVAEWKSKQLPLNQNQEQQLDALDALRTELFDSQFIGIYENGIGYGNISMRATPATQGNTSTSFIISATATGGARTLGSSGYSLITKLDINANTVWSTGPLPPSSETMTHAAIYHAAPHVNCVVHIHNRKLFDGLLQNDIALKTPANIPYGTVEMAHATMKIAQDYPLEACVVMTAHDEGIIFYGISIAQVRSQIAFVNHHIIQNSCQGCKKHSTQYMA